MARLWTCAGCRCRFDYRSTAPAIDAKACLFYGSYGRPPFAMIGESHNCDGPLIGHIRYCDECVF